LTASLCADAAAGMAASRIAPQSLEKIVVTAGPFSI
jgi:hypothetical protein